MSRVLILETSTAVCSVSIVDKDSILVTKETSEPYSHSSLLSVKIQEALDELGIKVKDLSAVAVSSGPGSYTGLRVGSSTAKGLCFGADIPLISLDTLKGLSYAPHALQPTKNNYLFSAIDARRDEVYAAVYDPNHHLLLPGAPVILDEDSFKRFRQENAIWHFSGDGAEKAIELVNFPNCQLSSPTSSSIFFHKMAMNLLRAEKFEDIKYFAPNYFKAPNITKSNKPLI